jgi:hypothetical protein
LNQCTRIFPPEPKPPKPENSGKEGEENDLYGKEENNEEENEEETKNNDTDNEGSTTVTKPKKDSTKPPGANKVASYEDIIFQVFLQDKRQTMRLRCPLPNRAKMTDDNSSFLPPLDPPPASSRSSFSSMVSHCLRFSFFLQILCVLSFDRREPVKVLLVGRHRRSRRNQSPWLRSSLQLLRLSRRSDCRRDCQWQPQCDRGMLLKQLQWL